jgi:hypothetical protein
VSFRLRTGIEHKPERNVANFETLFEFEIGNPYRLAKHFCLANKINFHKTNRTGSFCEKPCLQAQNVSQSRGVCFVKPGSHATFHKAGGLFCETTRKCLNKTKQILPLIWSRTSPRSSAPNIIIDLHAVIVRYALLSYQRMLTL